MKPNKASSPARINTVKMIIRRIQIANFNRYQPMMAAIMITKKRTIKETSMNANIIITITPEYLYSVYTIA